VEAKVALAKKQASIGMALLVMGQSGKVWAKMKHQADPVLPQSNLEECLVRVSLT
jgi:hypothetical protein